MPTVLRIGPYRFHFFPADRLERPHVHVYGPNGESKFWIDQVELSETKGAVRPRELRRIAQLVRDNQEHLLRSWNDFFAQ